MYIHTYVYAYLRYEELRVRMVVCGMMILLCSKTFSRKPEKEKEKRKQPKKPLEQNGRLKNGDSELFGMYAWSPSKRRSMHAKQNKHVLIYSSFYYFFLHKLL